ncbi:MAG: hypothetical protein QXN36_02400 [Candidatus Bathyarchaeia archaeon]
MVTTAFIALSYYVRTTSSLRLWRIIWIIAGIGVIGFPLFIIMNFLVIKALSPIIGFWIPFSITMATSISVGAFVGDHVGKRRDYKPLA